MRARRAGSRRGGPLSNLSRRRIPPLPIGVRTAWAALVGSYAALVAIGLVAWHRSDQPWWFFALQGLLGGFWAGQLGGAYQRRRPQPRRKS